MTMNSMISIASNYAAADDDTRESLKAYAIQNSGWRNNNRKKERARLRSSIPWTWWQQPSPKVDKADSAAGGGVAAVASSGAPQLLPPHQLLPYIMMNITTFHALPIRMQRENATIPTRTVSLSMTSRQTKKQATSAPDVQDLTAKEKQTRTRSPRMVAIWKKIMRPRPLKKLRLVLADQTHSRIPRREPTTPPWPSHGKGTKGCHELS
jgi:hypothetical protein